MHIFIHWYFIWYAPVLQTPVWTYDDPPWHSCQTHGPRCRVSHTIIFSPSFLSSQARSCWAWGKVRQCLVQVYCCVYTWCDNAECSQKNLTSLLALIGASLTWLLTRTIVTEIDCQCLLHPSHNPLSIDWPCLLLNLSISTWVMNLIPFNKWTRCQQIQCKTFFLFFYCPRRLKKMCCWSNSQHHLLQAPADTLDADAGETVSMSCLAVAVWLYGGVVR